MRAIPYIGKLLNNANLSPTIKDAFYNWSGFDVDRPFVHHYRAFIKPMHIQLLKILSTKALKHLKGKPLDQEKYLSEYGKGFEHAYYNFNEDILSQKTIVFSNDDAKAQIIYDHATGDKNFMAGAFSITDGDGVHPFIGWYNDGITAGYIYRAWYIILQNHQIFESYFIAAKEKTIPDPLDITLKELFIDPAKYVQVMQLLVDEEYCQAKSYVWKDMKKGNKLFLAATIKQIHLLGYLKKRPTRSQIVKIALDTFKIELGPDTVKDAKPENFELPNIPPA